MSNRTTDKPNPSMKNGYELSLSGAALTEIMQAVLSQRSLVKFRAKGFSMYPFIKDGDVLTISPLNGTPPGLGEVVAFIPPGTDKLTIHRVIGGESPFRLMKGDNASQHDGLIPEANILGHVTKLEREGKRIYLGFGPERLLVALFSRSGILPSLLGSILKIMKRQKS